jgi:hypothetical protein
LGDLLLQGGYLRLQRGHDGLFRGVGDILFLNLKNLACSASIWAWRSSTDSELELPLDPPLPQALEEDSLSPLSLLVDSASPVALLRISASCLAASECSRYPCWRLCWNWTRNPHRCSVW